MHTGMLWFDNSTATLNTKLQKAAEYYVKKYGRNPDLVLIHPAMMEANQKSFELEHTFKDGEVEHNLKLYVRPYRPVLNGHIWIGIEDKN